MEEVGLSGLITIDEAVKRSGFSRSWITRLLNEERLKGLRVHGKAWLVDVKDLQRYAKEKAPIGRPQKPVASPKKKQTVRKRTKP